jgi:hypothetical protein
MMFPFLSCFPLSFFSFHSVLFSFNNKIPTTNLKLERPGTNYTWALTS